MSARPLTLREQQILGWAICGASTGEIARSLGISDAAVSQAKGRVINKGHRVPPPMRDSGDRAVLLADLRQRRERLDELIARLEGAGMKDAAE